MVTDFLEQAGKEILAALFQDPRLFDGMPFSFDGTELGRPYGRIVQTMLDRGMSLTNGNGRYSEALIRRELEMSNGAVSDFDEQALGFAGTISQPSEALRLAAECREVFLRRRVALVARDLVESPRDDELLVRDAALRDELARIQEFVEGGQSAIAEGRRKFRPENTSIEYALDADPPAREWLVRDFMPARESGLVVAAGGTGKGHFQMALAVAMAVGFDFGGFAIPKPRGVVLASVEDDRDEMHRRLRAALDIAFRDKSIGWKDVRELLLRRIRFIELRGITGVRLGPAMRDQILKVVGDVEDPGLVFLDPMSRLLPDLRETGGLNSQEGAGIVLNELDALRSATGCTILGAHHIAKEAIRNGGELELTAATGSQQLVDLSRWVLNLKRLKSHEVGAFGLPRGHYLRAAVTKTNYSPPLNVPMVFQRCEGGALAHVLVESKQAHDPNIALAILRSLGEWTSAEDWRNAGRKGDAVLAKNRIDAARNVLLGEGRIERRGAKRGRTRRVLYAPADWREIAWPDPPKGDD